FIRQPLSPSIPYTLPPTLRTQIPNPYPPNILLIPDRSLQLTLQSLSTIIPQNLNPLIFLINNHRYTLHTIIHPIKQPYNHIPISHYKSLPSLFPPHNLLLHHLNTSQQLILTFQNIKSNTHPIHFLEVKI
ncbi:thiamine pyrophosphate-dependent enzyme, partial [Staphylococcus epidermidis]